MTITIHRPVGIQRPAVFLGLAAILVVAAFAVFQNTETDPVDAGAANVSTPTAGPESADPWARLQSVQDNYLPPTVNPAPADPWARLQSVQDNYLPPTVNPALAELEPNGINDITNRGPVLAGDRTNAPR